MSILAERIKELRLSNNMTQRELADKLNLSAKMVSFYELSQRVPPMDIVLKLTNIFNVSTDYLLGKLENKDNPYIIGAQTPTSKSITIEKSISNSAPKGIKIPVLGRVVAGIPLQAIENIEGYEEISPAMAVRGEFFALRVKGKSMEPYLLENDTVIVKKQNDVENNAIAIILVNGDEATVKKIRKQETGITLIGLNTSVYEPHFYTNAEVLSLPIVIVGRVVEIRRALP